MHTTKFLFVLAGAATLAACNHVEATHNRCGGTTACAKGACDPIDVLSDRPSRPYRELGVVEVRVDRGTALRNVTLADAMPALVAEARSMGADAVILTHEEFTSWYDKGEPASPIHDLERQESWYITEKARYVSGLAVVYTAPPCAPPRAGVPVAPSSSGRIVSTRIVPNNGSTYSAPVYVAPAAPVAPATPPPPPPASLPEATMPLPTPPPAPTVPPVPAPPPAPEMTVPVPAVPETPTLPPVPEVPKLPDVPAPPPTPDLPPVPRPPDVPPVPPAPTDVPTIPK